MKDDRGHAFKNAVIELVDTANDEQIEWLIEFMWHCKKLYVLRWFNRHFFQREVPERE